MKKYKSLVYKLHPTKEQTELFEKTFGCCRKVYNLALEDTIKQYEETKKVSFSNYTSYIDKYPYLREVSSVALNHSVRNVYEAFQNYFGKKRKKHAAFPHFKAKGKCRKSFTLDNVANTIRFEEKGLRLPTAGIVKITIDSLPDPTWKIKAAIVSQHSNGNYYVAVRFLLPDVPVPEVTIDENNSIGIVKDLDGIYRDSNNFLQEKQPNLKKTQKKLAKAQKKLARKQGKTETQEASKNYEKQLRKVGKLSSHMANQRKDLLRKESTKLANQYDVICAGDATLICQEQVDEKRPNKVSGTGYSDFLSMLEYKMADRGKKFVKVDSLDSISKNEFNQLSSGEVANVVKTEGLASLDNAKIGKE